MIIETTRNTVTPSTAHSIVYEVFSVCFANVPGIVVMGGSVGGGVADQ